MAGVFEGIGAEVSFIFDQNELKKLQNEERNVDALLLLPTVILSAILPGSPAKKAGLMAGDEVVWVNGKWVISSDEVRRVREVGAQVAAKKLPPEALERARTEMNEKVRNNMVANKARDTLTVGSGEEIQLRVRRGGATLSFSLKTSETKVEPVSLSPDGILSLRAFSSAPDRLRSLNVDWNKVQAIDLRDSTSGDSSVILPLLELIASPGLVGFRQQRSGSGSEEVRVAKGVNRQRETRILIDESTTGASLAIALALSNSPLTPLQGKLASETAPWISVYSLPDESGYTLRTGAFSAKRPAAAPITAQNNTDSKGGAQ
jgi:C-terminal processing protease CtpA/Prc